MLRHCNEFFHADRPPRSRPALIGIAFGIAFSFAATAWAGGNNFIFRYAQPSIRTGACNTVPSVYSPYRSVTAYNPRFYSSYPYRNVGGLGNYYSSGPNGTFYGYNTGFYDRNEFESERFREERRRNDERDRQRQAAERAEREREREQRERNAFHPKPAQPYQVTVHGYGHRTYESVVEATLSRNQNEARSHYSQPPVPEEARGMTMVGVGDDQYYYSKGTFYALDGDNNLAEVEAPQGAMVFSIPEKAETVKVGNTTYYTFDKTYYTRIQVMGRLVYKVVPNPRG